MSEKTEEDSGTHPEARPFAFELPVPGSDHPYLNRLGVELGPFAEGDRMRPVRVPVGWTAKKINNRHYVIKNQKDCLRAAIFIDKHKLQIQAYSRFTTGRDNTVSDNNVHLRLCVWDAGQGPEKKVLFEVNYPVPNSNRHKSAHDNAVETYVNKNECRKWLNENYPDWTNIFAYWED